MKVAHRPIPSHGGNANIAPRKLLAYALAPLQSRLTRFAARSFRRAQTLNNTGLQQV